MKTKAHIGTNCTLDISRLITTRMLIQANSGGGKSYAIRKILEETHGAVQQIVLDIEGDFSSLRTKFDYVLAGKGGDIDADPKHAAFLARKLLELKADTIIDLYELKQHERIRFVKLFLDAMVNAPKDLWHPVLLMIDEAHIFCPEKGSAESSGAVIDICTRGRKRGYCAVLATQRISKLNKDAAAECNNKMIGRTTLDIDRKRAADELGFLGNMSNILRDLEAGEFYTFGPAFNLREVNKTQVGKTTTEHPRAGQRSLSHKPAASSVIKSVLSKIGDVAGESEAELQTIAELKARVRELERAKPTVMGATDKEIKELRAEYQKKLDSQVRQLKREVWKDFLLKIDAEYVRLRTETSKMVQGLSAELETIAHVPNLPSSLFVMKEGCAPRPQLYPTTKTERIRPANEALGACERKILGFLATDPRRSYSKVQVGAMSGYAHGSGGFNNALSRLTQAGLIARANGQIQISIQGEKTAATFPSEIPHKLSDWIAKLGACERKIYELVLSRPSDALSKDAVAAETGYAVGSGGFNNALSRLNTLGLIRRDHGVIALNPELMGS